MAEKAASSTVPDCDKKVVFSLPCGRIIVEFLSETAINQEYLSHRSNPEITVIGSNLESRDSFLKSFLSGFGEFGTTKEHRFNFYQLTEKTGESLAWFAVSNASETQHQARDVRLYQFMYPTSDRKTMKCSYEAIIPFLEENRINNDSMNCQLCLARDISGNLHFLDDLPDGFTHQGDLTIQLVDDRTVILPRNMHIMGNLIYEHDDSGRGVTIEDLTVDGNFQSNGPCDFNGKCSIGGTFSMKGDQSPLTHLCDQSLTLNGEWFIAEIGGLQSVAPSFLEKDNLDIKTECSFKGISRVRRNYKMLSIHADILQEPIPEAVTVSNMLSLKFRNGEALPASLRSSHAAYLRGVEGYRSIENWKCSGALALDRCKISVLPDYLDLDYFELEMSDLLEWPKDMLVSSVSIHSPSKKSLETVFRFREFQQTFAFRDSSKKFQLRDSQIREIHEGTLVDFSGSIIIEEQEFLPKLPEEMNRDDVQFKIHRVGYYAQGTGIRIEDVDLNTAEFFHERTLSWNEYNFLRERLDELAEKRR